MVLIRLDDLRSVLAKQYGKEVAFDEELITPKMAARLLGCSARHIERIIARKHLKPVQICCESFLRIGDVLDCKTPAKATKKQSPTRQDSCRRRAPATTMAAARNDSGSADSFDK